MLKAFRLIQLYFHNFKFMCRSLSLRRMINSLAQSDCCLAFSLFVAVWLRGKVEVMKGDEQGRETD